MTMWTISSRVCIALAALLVFTPVKHVAAQTGSAAGYSSWEQAAPAWDIQPWEAPPVGGGSPPEAVKYVSRSPGNPQVGLQFQLHHHFPAINNAWLPYSAASYYASNAANSGCLRACSQQSKSAGRDAAHREQLHNHCLASCQHGGFGSFAYGTHGAAFPLGHPYGYHPAAFNFGHGYHPYAFAHPQVLANTYAGLNGLYNPHSASYLGKAKNQATGEPSSFGLSLVDQHIACIAAGKLALQTKISKEGSSRKPTAEEIAESTRACAPLLQSAYHGGWNHGLAHGTDAFGVMGHVPHVTGFGTTTGQQFSLVNSHVIVKPDTKTSEDETKTTDDTDSAKKASKDEVKTTNLVDSTPVASEEQESTPTTDGQPVDSAATEAATKASESASASTAADEKSPADPVKEEADQAKTSSTDGSKVKVNEEGVVDSTDTEKKSKVDAGADQSKISTPPISFISLESRTLHPVFFKPYPHLAGHSSRHGECIERCNRLETQGSLDERVQQLQPCMEWCYWHEKNNLYIDSQSLQTYAPSASVAPYMAIRDQKSVDAAIVANPTAFKAKGSNEGAFKAMTKHIGFTKSSTFKATNRKVAALHGTRSWEGAMNYMFADSPPYTSENNPFEMRMAASQQ